MSTKNFLKRKLHGLRYNYGKLAADYFFNHPFCERCLDKRLVVLNIHHIKGKKVNEFKTLCTNCHVVEHNLDIANDTFESCQNYELFINEQENKKDQRILNLLNRFEPIRNIINIEKTCVSRIRKIMNLNGFKSKPQVGYFKIDGE